MDTVVAIGVVKVAVDLLKAVIPGLTGRRTQLAAFVLACGAAYLAVGGFDNIEAYVTAIGTIFAGALAADQLIKKIP